MKRIAAKFRITPVVVQAASLYGNGKTIAEIAHIVERSEHIVRQWLQRPEVIEISRQALREAVLPMVSRAARKLSTQVDSSNDWVAQGAARELLARYGDKAMGDETRDVVIRIEGLPKLGAPPPEPEI